MYYFVGRRKRCPEEQPERKVVMSQNPIRSMRGTWKGKRAADKPSYVQIKVGPCHLTIRMPFTWLKMVFQEERLSWVEETMRGEDV